MGRRRAVDVERESESVLAAVLALPSILEGWALGRSAAEQAAIEVQWKDAKRAAAIKLRRLRHIDARRRARAAERDADRLCRVCGKKPHNGGSHVGRGQARGITKDGAAWPGDGPLPVCNRCHRDIRKAYGCREGCVLEQRKPADPSRV